VGQDCSRRVFSPAYELALDDYSRTTSLWRVLLVIFATPVPMALLVVTQESLPLQDPADGWKANYGFWIRVVILESVVPSTVAKHAAIYIEGATLSSRQLVVFCIGVSVLSAVADMGIAACWTFPIPFFTNSLSMVVVSMMVMVFRAIVGGRAFREMGSHKEQLVEFNNFHIVNLLTMTTYPAFQVLFQATIDTKWERPTILLLPVIKLVLRYIFTRTFTTKEDLMPEEITFSVNFFDALYLATCMQSVRSFKTVLLIMAVDVLETVIELRELHRRTESTSTDLLDAVRFLCSQLEEVPQGGKGSDIRLRSCIRSHIISHSSSLLLQQMGSQSLHASSVQRHAVEATALEITSKTKWWQRALRGSDIQPMISVIPVGPTRQISDLQWVRQPVDGSVAALQEALEALFTAECLVLAEYLETFIPILYANYILVVVHLPSAKYHQEMQGLTAENVGGTVESIFLYAFLELLSFVVLAVIIQQNCGIQALYHLGFVLETQMSLVQSNMLIWVVITLTYRVIHFGKFIPECCYV
jgi:hypothetical protein